MYRILYVDDEPDLLEIGKIFLEESGDFTVITALSAPEALRLLEQEKFDVIISDYQMPGMDGIQFLVEVRTRFGQIPFILFTGRGREEVVIQAINSGADFYLQKGGEPESQFAELSHKVKQAALRKHADDALKRSEEKYRHLIEHSNEAILVAQDGMLKLVNHRLIELLGYSEQELLSTPFPVFIHPDDRAMVMERYQTRMKGGEVASRYPFRLNPKNENILWVEISAVVIDWDGRPATLNFLTDITERKVADDSLREEQQFSKLILDSLPGIFYLYTYPENRMIRWNRQHETLLGYTAEELKGKLATDLHLPEYKDAVLKAIDEVMEKGQGSVESTLLAKDGHQIPFFFTGVRFEVPGQLYFMGIGVDITERKRAEQEMVSAQERLKEAHRLAHIGTWDWVRETDTVTWSEELCKIAGWDPSLPAPTYAEFSHIYTPSSWEHFSSAVTRALTTGEPYNLELEMIRPDGSIRWTNAFGGVTRDENGKIIGLHGTVQDITERKREEEALRINENRLKMTQEIGHIGCWEYDIKTNLMWGSEEGCHLFGFPRMAGSYPIENFASCITEPEFVLKVFNDLINEGKEYDIDFIINPKDGSAQKTLHSIGRLEKDEQGNPVKVKGINQDITEHKRVEGALRESEARFRSYFNMPLQGIAITSPEKGWLHVNDRICSLLGYTRDEIIRMTWAEITHPDDLAADVKQFNRLLFGEIEQYTLNKRFICKDGSEIWTRIAVGCVRKPNSTVDYIVAVMEDITEHKHAQEALREARNRFEATLASLDDAVFLVDPVTRQISECNDATARIFGYSHEELAGKDSSFLHVDQAHFEQFGRDAMVAYDDPGYYATVFEMRRKDGNVFVSEHFVRPIRDPDGRILYVVSVVRDITERKKAEAALQESQKRFQALTETIEYSKDYQDMGAKPPKWQNVKIAMLFGLSHISIGQIQHSLETQNLEIYADPLLEKIFQRLFENSVKHGDHVTRIRVWHTVNPAGLTIIFEDNGTGISQEKKDLIFLRSEGPSASMRSLIFVREILDITGITIRENGEPGKSARFEMAVPKGAYRLTGTT